MPRRLILAIWAVFILAFASIASDQYHLYQFAPHHKWFESQKNSRGQVCCSEADGHPYYGGYTPNADGSVTLHLTSGDRNLPDWMILKGPNPTGHAIWWHMGDMDYCFAPGTLG